MRKTGHHDGSRYPARLLVLGAILAAAVAIATFAHSEPPPPGPPARGTPSTGVRYPIHATWRFVSRYDEIPLDPPPTIEELNKRRVWDFDPAAGIYADDFVLWTVDDLGNHDPDLQDYLRLTGRQLINGDYHLVIQMRNAPSLTDLFFYIRYHAEEWHPRNIDPGSAFGMEGDRLWFAKLDVPGVVCAGMTRLRPDISGGTTTDEGVVCEITFVNRPFDYKPHWLERAPDKARNKPENFTAFADPETGELVLYWEEKNAGDLNNDGEVSLTDLIPVGRRYGRVSKDGHEDDWDRLPDANDDGEVNYRDAWPIEENYGSLLSGYRIYRREAGDLPREGELLPHRTMPVLPMSIHRPKEWNPVRVNEYRFYDSGLKITGRPREWTYRIVPYNAADGIEGDGSALEVTVRVSLTAVTVREIR